MKIILLLLLGLIAGLTDASSNSSNVDEFISDLGNNCAPKYFVPSIIFSIFLIIAPFYVALKMDRFLAVVLVGSYVLGIIIMCICYSSIHMTNSFNIFPFIVMTICLFMCSGIACVCRPSHNFEKYMDEKVKSEAKLRLRQEEFGITETGSSNDLQQDLNHPFGVMKRASANKTILVVFLVDFIYALFYVCLQLCWNDYQ